MKYTVLIFLIISILAISGCGFKLRGSVELPKEMQNLYLQSYAPYSDLTREVKQNLALSHVHVVDSPRNALLTLNILNESVSNQQTTVASSDQRRNYLVNYVLTYQIESQQSQISIEPKTIQKQTTITLMGNEVIGNSSKLTQAIQDMRQEAIYQMMLQLASKEMRKKLSR